MTSRMERVWRELPLDLLEVVMTFLPLASLCQFRAVSKEWNRFINHPGFASHHARASSPEEYVLFGAWCDWNVREDWSVRGWKVLDVANKRFFHLSDDFLAEFIRQKGILVPCPPCGWGFHQRTILAVDGGLLCLSYYINNGCRSCSELETHANALLVCNPVLQTVKQLLHFAGWSKRPEWVVMSTDRDLTEYEIFFIALAEDALQPNVAYIYESKTTSWRASVAILGHLNALSGWRKVRYASAILKDEFYTIFSHHDEFHARLLSYNKVIGVVSDLGIDVPCDNDHCVSLHLVVSDGRLFCVIMRTKFNFDYIHQLNSIEIIEFILARREYIQLSMLGREMIFQLAHNNVHVLSFLNYAWDTRRVVVGFANSIFLCSCIVFNLSNRTWHTCPVVPNVSNKANSLFGSNLCLSLCPP